MVSVFMAAYVGQPGIGEFEAFRRAVVEAAGSRRSRLDVLAEVHEWLVRGRDRQGVISQLGDRLNQQGVRIVWEPLAEHHLDIRFRCHGSGAVRKVICPAYTVDVEGQETVIRQGDLECEPEALIVHDSPNADEAAPGVVEPSEAAGSENQVESPDGGAHDSATGGEQGGSPGRGDESGARAFDSERVPGTEVDETEDVPGDQERNE